MAVGGCGAWRLAKGDIIGISPYSSDKQISLSIRILSPHHQSSILAYQRHHPSIQAISTTLDTCLTTCDKVQDIHTPHNRLIRHLPKAHTSLLPLPLGSPWPPILGRQYYNKHQSQWDYSLAVWSLCHSLVKQVDGHRMQVDGEKGRKEMKTTRVS
jgi:hypothetical protein